MFLLVTLMFYSKNGDFTKEIETVVMNFGESIHATRNRKMYEKLSQKGGLNFREPREKIPEPDWGNERWHRISTTAFSVLWQCYFMSTINWEKLKDLKESNLKFLYHQDVCYFTSSLPFLMINIDF